ncbi:MAG: hypothetical protein KF689_00805 [Gemmatimonadaceae bacterium]|nr:hypothetical protein [Gemmatimonadaceae bacterium]MCW5826468.1 hypothetical protein [Gemmatimonadaceae bacterium]
MSTGALIFMLVSWTAVLSLTGWAFATLLRDRKHFDPDGIGPAAPEQDPSGQNPRGGIG